MKFVIASYNYFIHKLYTKPNSLSVLDYLEKLYSSKSYVINLDKLHREIRQCLRSTRTKVLAPPFSPATYIARSVGKEGSDVVPLPIAVLYRRQHLSDPFDFRLFLDDLEILASYRDLKQDWIAVAVYDVYLYRYALSRYIPIVLIPKDFDVAGEAYVLTLRRTATWIRIDDSLYVQLNVDRSLQSYVDDPISIARDRGYDIVEHCDIISCIPKEFIELPSNTIDVEQYLFRRFRERSSLSRELVLEVSTPFIPLIDGIDVALYLWIQRADYDMLNAIHRLISSLNTRLERSLIVTEFYHYREFGMPIRNSVYLSQWIELLANISKCVHILVYGKARIPGSIENIIDLIHRYLHGKTIEICLDYTL